MKYREIEIPWKELIDAEWHLSNGIPWDGKQVATKYIYTVDFGEGEQADIKACNGNPPYVDAVLFRDGCEICVAEPSDNLLGEYYLETEDGNLRLVIVHPEGYMPSPPTFEKGDEND